ncbi:MAG: tryptophan--tRNA ligase [Candidatus Magasanikbacteria bacterium RIFCSPHIGHO2_02_FULL_41_13]|uniref:Tryptophan--tRNA ligase n=1 Tax=Candidatus Magasanikbacteria bacterium RIFCSPHIGHO2_02_FULL_41_13 TaxID=1798676 RepID=A0A1F6M2Y7_9BACT|nr:MAG: tryptophan--tRNA ligase [Candidatus Magasanikbacteria bacterium RIFCSPHIGHO2_02_FULL_41_13]
MSKPIVVSGIQPTGNPHIGNYLGAMKNWVDMQNSGKYDCYFMIVDLHSLTGDMDAKTRRDQITRTAIDMLSIGLDPHKSTIFVQSHIQEHTELGWIFNTITPIAELERMTQFKDKSTRQTKNINTGLLTYPALMAADILLYHGTLVPVGQDQIQHVELTRDCARWFNNRYGGYFPEAKPLLTETPKIMSLLEPEKKMSKSHGVDTIIELSDEPEVIMKKLKKAVTATEGGSDSPGAKNLIELLKYFATSQLHNQYLAAEKDGSIRYGDLKTDLANAISGYFEEFRIRRTQLLANHDEIADILSHGAEKARAVAQKTMDEVRRKVGIR